MCLLTTTAANERAEAQNDFEPLVNLAWRLYVAKGYYAATDQVWMCHRQYVEGRLALSAHR